MSSSLQTYQTFDALAWFPTLFSFFSTVAKEQGLRSRAAFKLSQINRQYPVLEKAKVVLDLCAAPGGWTQVAARTCSQNTQIIAVDILPIRAFPGHRNITTIVGDITTDKCKADIARNVKKNAANINAREHNKGAVDVVLHDGAPNIGASYEKDAYEQTEIALHALKCATHHLKRHGTFITKLYRSRDYQSYHWVMQQLFTKVHTIKPKASRSASAEIFLIGQDYLQPDTIDPKLLDPTHIFAPVEGDTTVASSMAVVGGNSVSATFNVFHKSWDKATSRRQRDGYDMDALDATLRRIQPVSDFIHAKSMQDAIQLLSTCSGFQFRCDNCPKKSDKTAAAQSRCRCQWYLHHPLTSAEIRECATDLKVLNKNDFRGLLTWRDKMQQAEEAMKEREKDSDDSSDDDDDSSDEEEGKVDQDEGDDEEKEENIVQREIAALRERKQKERKKQKKKERELAAKKRKRAALGMNLNAIDIDGCDPLGGGSQIFSLATLASKGDLEAVSEINLDQVTHEEAFGADDSDDEVSNLMKSKGKEKDEETGYSYRLEQELDEAYEKYLTTTKNSAAKVGTKKAKRSKKLMREKLAEEAHEDQEMLLAGSDGIDADTKAYAKLLNQTGDDSDGQESDSDNDDGDDDGFHDDPMTPEEHAAASAHKKKKQKTANQQKEKNPLIHEFPDNEPKSLKAARWFSNPLFAEIGKAAESATTAPERDVPGDESSSDDDDSDGSDDESNRAMSNGKKKKRGLDADEVLAMIPKTDKQIRHERRLKAISREERRQARKARKLGETEGEFALAPAEDGDDDDDSDLENEMAGMSEEKKRKLLEARELIKAGMGAVGDDAGDRNSKIEVVAQDRPLPVMDHRKYDSENEDYDSDDYARTLALGTMMMRRSKAKALVDASYNRYAWNDPEDLPEWFVDDENRHYRPQLPIPPALIAKMKERQLALSVRPIAKVAEARARKNKKAKLKLAAAKKKAQAVANSSEMSEAMKLKAISKALRSEDGKSSGKKYVVAKKGRGAGAGGMKGTKVVDKRLKSDKRAMDRASSKKKHGKKGGMTGSKRRRHHKQ